MFTKILVTITLVIVAIAIFLRRRASLQQRVIIVNEEPDRTQLIVKWFVYGVAGLSLLTGAFFYYLNWRDGYRVYDITITNPQTGKVDTYRAYKKDLHGHSFTSIAGHNIMVSELERIEYSEAP